LNELCPDFFVVVKLTVDNSMGIAVWAVERLITAGRKVPDGETSMAKCYRARQEGFSLL